MMYTQCLAGVINLIILCWCRHGLGRTDYYILYDNDLCFREIIRRHNSGEPLITAEEKLDLTNKFFPEHIEKDKPHVTCEKVVKNSAKEEKSKTGNSNDKTASDSTENTDISSAPEKKEIDEKSTENDKDSSEKVDSELSNDETKKSEQPKENADVPEKDGEDKAESSPKSEQNNETPEDQVDTSEKQEEASPADETAKSAAEEEAATPSEEKTDDSEAKPADSEEKAGNSEEKSDETEEAKEEAGSSPTETSENAAPTDDEKESVDNKETSTPKEDSTDVATEEAMEVHESKSNDKNEETSPVTKEDAMETDEISDKTEASDLETKKEQTPETKTEEAKTVVPDELSIEEETKPLVKSEGLTITKIDPADVKREENGSLKGEIKYEDEKPSVNLIPIKSDVKPKDALLSLQQMDEAMAKLGAANMDPMVTSEPTVAQLLAQSAANPIKWPKERAIQNRVEHIMYAVEKNRWPVDKYFVTTDSESRDMLVAQQMQQQQMQQQMHDSERQRAVDAAELEKAHLHALLHPNLHHTLGLNKGGISANSLRSFLESEGREKLSQSDSNALRQLQALQGSLDLTIRPVSSSSNSTAQLVESMAATLVPPPRRGPGRPRLDDPLRAAEKRMAEQLHHLQPQEKKRRKLDEIVMGLSSKSKGPDQITSLPKDTNPLSLLRGSAVSLLSSRDKSILTNAISSPRLSTSISISQSSDNKRPDSRDSVSTPSKSGEGSSGRLVNKTDLPPGISLPPGIELYRPNESKVDKWLEQHQGYLGEASPAKDGSSASSSSNRKRRLEDWSSQLTGEEHVPLLHSKTGQKVRKRFIINFSMIIGQHLNVTISIFIIISLIKSTFLLLSLFV